MSQRTDARSVPDGSMRDPLAAADRVAPLRRAADEQRVAAAAAVDQPAAEVRVDDVVAAAGDDRVRPVAPVDDVATRAAEEAVVLARRLAGGLVVAPDDVAPRPGVDGVAAVAAEQLVVALLESDDAVAGVDAAAAATVARVGFARVLPDEPPLADAAQVDFVAGVVGV